MGVYYVQFQIKIIRQTRNTSKKTSTASIFKQLLKKLIKSNQISNFQRLKLQKKLLKNAVFETGSVVLKPRYHITRLQLIRDATM